MNCFIIVFYVFEKLENFWENTRNCVGIVNERTVSFFGPLPFRLENRLIFWFNFLTFGTSDGGGLFNF